MIKESSPKKVQFWTTILLLLNGWMLTIVFKVPRILHPKLEIPKNSDPLLTKMLEEFYEMSSSIPYKTLLLLQVVLTIVSFAFVVLAFSSLKKQELPSGWHYSVFLALPVMTIIQAFFVPMPTSSGMSFNASVLIGVIFFNCLLSLPAMLSLYHLSKIEPKKRK